MYIVLCILKNTGIRRTPQTFSKAHIGHPRFYELD
jgi:hypothetical protein